mmetsp:Transcript_45722/g.108344  ORF Transcript_45722/g.108344 Transcript_45722/m.108344 type:complete len:242 (-) Transcript_45722:77-802(-)
MLGGLCLLFVRHRRHQRDLDNEHVLCADAVLELAEPLNEGHALDVAHRPAQLDHAHVCLIPLILGIGAALDGAGGDFLDPLADGVGDVRHNLHSLAEVLALPLPLNHLLVDLARRDVVVRTQGDVQKALVVAQIEVGFAAIVQDEGLAMLKGRHRSSIHVEVRIDLDHVDLPPAALKEHSDTARGDALAQARHDTAGNDDVLHFSFHRRLGAGFLPRIFRGAFIRALAHGDERPLQNVGCR